MMLDEPKRVAMRTLLFALFLLISSSSLANDVFVDAKTNFAFPQRVAGFSFYEKTEYGDPRLGYGLNYFSEDGILITVIVYDLGLKDIPDGINGFRVQEEMKNAQDDVYQMINLGHYRSVHLINKVGVSFPLFLRTSYTILDSDGVQKRSHIFIRGQNKHFVKIRATGPGNTQIDLKIASFIYQLSTVIGSNKPMQSMR